MKFTTFTLALAIVLLAGIANHSGKFAVAAPDYDGDEREAVDADGRAAAPPGLWGSADEREAVDADGRAAAPPGLWGSANEREAVDADGRAAAPPGLWGSADEREVSSAV